MKQIFKKPSYYLLSQAMDGDEKRLKRYWHFMTRTYQSAVCVHSMMNTASKQRPVEKENWIRVENTHEPIIDRQLWDKVQKLLTKNIGILI